MPCDGTLKAFFIARLFVESPPTVSGRRRTGRAKEAQIRWDSVAYINFEKQRISAKKGSFRKGTSGIEPLTSETETIC